MISSQILVIPVVVRVNHVLHGQVGFFFYELGHAFGDSFPTWINYNHAVFGDVVERPYTVTHTIHIFVVLNFNDLRCVSSAMTFFQGKRNETFPERFTGSYHLFGR